MYKGHKYKQIRGISNRFVQSKFKKTNKYFLYFIEFLCYDKEARQASLLQFHMFQSYIFKRTLKASSI